MVARGWTSRNSIHIYNNDDLSSVSMNILGSFSRQQQHNEFENAGVDMKQEYLEEQKKLAGNNAYGQMESLEDFVSLIFEKVWKLWNFVLSFLTCCGFEFLFAKRLIYLECSPREVLATFHSLMLFMELFTFVPNKTKSEALDCLKNTV